MSMTDFERDQAEQMRAQTRYQQQIADPQRWQEEEAYWANNRENDLHAEIRKLRDENAKLKAEIDRLQITQSQPKVKSTRVTPIKPDGKNNGVDANGNTIPWWAHS